MNERELEKQLKALANRRRLSILKYLKIHREAAVSEIADAIHLSLKATSKHLGILATLDIIERDQRSLQVFYRLAANNLPAIKHILSIL